MTLSKTKNHSSGTHGYIALATALSSIVISIAYGKEITEAAAHSLRLCLTSILPAIFPYMILSDLLATVKIKSDGFIGKVFRRLFGISPRAFTAFLSGAICGFPIGVKTAVSLYENGAISKKECEHLIGFSNNPSLAFIIYGVGVGMRGSLDDGYFLYFSVLISAVIIGFIFKDKSAKTEYSVNIIGQKFDFVSSVKSAGSASVSIAAFIVFFSCIIEAINEVTKSEFITVIFSTFLEIGNAAARLNSENEFAGISLYLTAFALGFSGISVHMQAESFLPPEISRKKYYIMKLTQGFFSAAASLLLSFLISK